MRHEVKTFKFVCDGCKKEEIVQDDMRSHPFDSYWILDGWRVVKVYDGMRWDYHNEDYCPDCNDKAEQKARENRWDRQQ